MTARTTRLKTASLQILAALGASISRLRDRIEDMRRTRDIARMKAHLSWQPTERGTGRGRAGRR